jgi:hypothetical protein
MVLCRLARGVTLEWVWRDLWVGLFIKEPKARYDKGWAWKEHHLFFACLGLVLHITWGSRARRITDGAHDKPGCGQ